MIEKRLLLDIEQYCELNDIEDKPKFINDLLRDAFISVKWSKHSPVNKEPKEVTKNEEVETNVEEEIEIPVFKKFNPPTKNQDIYGE
jgi:hypothetical protein